MSLKEKVNIPNIITLVRIIGSAVILFVPVFSVPFYVLYSVCGVSDVLDGFVARSTGKTTAFGSKLDSAADLIFYSIMGIKVFRTLMKVLPILLWIGVGITFSIRVAIYLYAAFKQNRFVATHSYLNKATGAGVFGIPYLIRSSVFTIYGSVVCTIAVIAAINDLHILVKKHSGKEKTV